MAVRLWSAFLPDLAPDLPQCPTVVITHHLKRAAQQFFQESRAWQVLIETPLPVAEGDTIMALDLGDVELALVRLERAWYDGTTMDVRTADELEHDDASAWWDETGTPTLLVQLTPTEARLHPVPLADAATGITFRASVKPSEAATGVREDLAAKYLDGLVAGCLARLMAMPDKPWSRPDRAQEQAAKFRAALDQAASDTRRAHGRARSRSNPLWC